MQLSFRWFGESDPVSLEYIRQIPGMVGIVTALYDVPAGVLWPKARLISLKQQIEAAGLTFNVVESLPVHEDIKLGRDTRDALLAIYRQNIVQLAELGVEVICYNFMPLFDWYRTDLAFELSDKSTVLHYDHRLISGMKAPSTADLAAYFPLDESPEALKTAYRAVGEAELWENLRYFLAGIVPTAEQAGIKLGIHPDDPPWSIFNLPRIVTDAASLERIIGLVDSPANGLTFCTGSLGANPYNDLPAMIRRFGERIHFAHCRNVKHVADKVFHEVAHPPQYGDVDLVAVMRAFADVGFRGPLRPDHGRMIWGESGKPGYGLYDRALGAVYLLGVWQAIVG